MTDLTRIDDGPVATVYSGHRAGVPVAFKVFPERFDKRTMSAFTKEQARLSTAGGATSILTVDGVERMPTGESALRMELCTQSLAALVERRGPLPAPDAIILGRAIATALSAAHSVGVVHGGLSPHNILFRENNEPVVSDFGTTLRQAFPRDPLYAIEYLPPETLRSGTLNAETDLYGMGAVLHFALTGCSPHPGRLGEQPAERVRRILGEPIRAITRADVPVGLSTLVARLLSPTPRYRPRNATQVAAQLTSMLPGPPKPRRTEHWDDFDHSPLRAPVSVPARPLPARRTVRYDLLVAAVLALVLVALVPILVVRGESGTFAVPTAASAHPARGVTVELARPTDLTDRVRLTWTATRDVDFAVVVAAEGQATRVLLAERNHSMTVDVEPGVRYCFLVQASDGDRVYESEPQPLRGASCGK